VLIPTLQHLKARGVALPTWLLTKDNFTLDGVAKLMRHLGYRRDRIPRHCVGMLLDLISNHSELHRPPVELYFGTYIGLYIPGQPIAQDPTLRRLQDVDLDAIHDADLPLLIYYDHEHGKHGWYGANAVEPSDDIRRDDTPQSSSLTVFGEALKTRVIKEFHDLHLDVMIAMLIQPLLKTVVGETIASLFTTSTLKLQLIGTVPEAELVGLTCSDITRHDPLTLVLRIQFEGHMRSVAILSFQEVINSILTSEVTVPADLDGLDRDTHLNLIRDSLLAISSKIRRQLDTSSFNIGDY